VGEWGWWAQEGFCAVRWVDASGWVAERGFGAW